MSFGITLILFGVVFLAKNLGLVTADVWGVLWPILLIAIGAGLLLKKRGISCWCWNCSHKHRDSSLGE